MTVVVELGFSCLDFGNTQRVHNGLFEVDCRSTWRDRKEAPWPKDSCTS